MDFKNPDCSLEQYKTPAVVGARLLYDAMLKGDIKGISVFDPGCGTGALAIGAKLLDADYVLGIDIDFFAVETAKKNAESLSLEVDFFVSDIKNFNHRHFDTVVMNPPFGAQNVHADRPFIDAALDCADVVYSIFNKGSLAFLKAYTKKRAEITDVFTCSYPIKHTFSHHTKECAFIDVEIVRMVKL